MAKEHKYHYSHTKISTALAPDRALALASETVAARRGLKVESSGPEGLMVDMKNAFGISYMKFAVGVQERPGGGANLYTQIADYTITQETIFMLIPVGPRMMEGYGLYKGYMRALAEVIHAADPEATVTIDEYAELTL